MTKNQVIHASNIKYDVRKLSRAPIISYEIFCVHIDGPGGENRVLQSWIRIANFNYHQHVHESSLLLAITLELGIVVNKSKLLINVS